MIAYSKAGPIPFKSFTFPDGQPHLELQLIQDEWREATIETAIRNPKELFETLLLADALRGAGYYNINLDIRYLMGARMDRVMGLGQPFTLQVVCRTLNAQGFRKVRILDPHSEAACNMLGASKVYPMEGLKKAIDNCHMVVIPDKGATSRVAEILNNISYPVLTRQAHKHRNPATGALSGFSVDDPSSLKDCHLLIIDDICDGGGTFTGLAKVLIDAGALRVSLFVTHGIFSKGTQLGLSAIYTTNSYQDGFEGSGNVVCFPVSMKEIA